MAEFNPIYPYRNSLSTADVRDILGTMPVKQGAILPLTEYADGSARLDWTAGLPGSVINALTAPARAYRGDIAPDQMVPEAMNFAGNVTLGSLAATKPAGALAAGAAREEPKGFIAYHGSPHDFDRFDMSKIGTGEGAQAYGRGLYFADAEDVAKSYRDNITSSRHLTSDMVEDATGRYTMPGYVAVSLDAKIPNDQLKAGLKVRDPKATPEQINSWIEEGQKIYDAAASKGRLYQVRINADPDHFLDWDKPLSQQSEAVRKAYETALTSRGGPTIDKIGSSSFGSSGEAMQNLLSAWSKHDATSVSQSMRDAGIPGIKYLDQGSRAAGDGSRNYVVFDDKLIEILKKYGLIGMLGGGMAASNSLADAQP